MRKRVFSVHITTGANSYAGIPEAIFWRSYQDGRTAGSRDYLMDDRLAAFIERLGAIHGVTNVYGHPIHDDGALLYQAINIKGRYQQYPPPTETPEIDWPDEWD